MKFKKFLPLLAVSIIATSCNNTQTIKKENIEISKDTKFGLCNVYTTKEELSTLGINLGDSCDIVFSNGYKLIDIPYYDGYYVRTGDPVIVAYPSSTNIIVTYNNIGIWDSAKLSENDTVSIYLNTSKKFLTTQEALSQSYSLEREKYSSDEEFSNFRTLSGGSLKENIIYRGASPVDNSRKRAKITDSLLKKNNISAVIDLADSSEDLATYMASSDFDSPYTKDLITNGNLIPLSMGSSYTSDSYKTSVVSGLRFLMTKSAPYYIHCMEGKDRTGFVCMLIEALCGATYEEMCKDYMQTYYNYYKVSETKTKEKYDAIVNLYFDSFMEYLAENYDDTSYATQTYVDFAKKYLKDGGMTDLEITTLINKLTK